MTIVAEGQARLQQELEGYALDENIMDETGLFYRMEPNATLSTSPVHGKKKNKERITFALCTNASGTDKLKPFVIGKFHKPRCFGSNFDPNQITRYRNNTKAWMTALLFTE